MGGDHKCPVCQATFTRPQHVARHMRSHTGDRPYKCQYCGDQFARSDLLSRHINKCHANEKPVPVQGRRKGSASASRATTSKQACDQCVQSSLPCDGSNPCVKCVQRKCRCTYVKFHRQTAPVGPGHNPRPNVPDMPPNSAAISSRLPMSYPSDDFFLQPPPAAADPLYPSQTFSFPSLYADTSNQDFTSKYRAQAEMLKSNPHFAPAGGGGSVGPGMSHMYSDPRSAPGAPSWVPWEGYHQLHDKDMHRGPEPLSHRQPHHSYVNSQGIPHPLQHSPPSGAGNPYPHSVQPSAAYLRRGSVEFGSSSDGSHDSPTTAEQSIPSSAASSNVHLPLDNLSMQQSQPLPFNPLDNLSDHHGDYRNGLANANAGGATSFFPRMMNLENGEGMSSLSQVPADDPDATPMPLKENPPPLSAPPVAMTLPLKSSSAAAAGGGNTLFMNQSNSGEPKEFRDFWKQYVRTPLSGPDGAPISSPPSSASLNGGAMSPPGYRRQRVASMPSSKTPAIATSLQSAHLQQRHNDRAVGGGESGVRTTLHDDLKSYEAAVMARKAPTNLNLIPKNRRGTVSALPPPSSAAGFGGGVQGVGIPSSLEFDTFFQNPQQDRFEYDARPNSASTDRSGSSGDGGSSFSLGGAYMHPHPPQSQQLQSPHLAGAQFMIRRGSPSASSTSTTGGESSSRASSVSAVDIGPDGQERHHHHHHHDDGYGGGNGGRPSYKRLASTTLAPVKAKKRASGLLKVGRGTSPTVIEMSGDGHGGDEIESPTSDVAQSFASSALGIH